MDIEKLSEERDDFIKTLIKVFPKMKNNNHKRKLKRGFT
jgi:hypothetical protein